ncbi:MAG: tRNA dihydrouridine synthase DusB, partial [Lachnospiraceae bacterium]|nr:tRNA dihydrouridine synthase DusB [Lachnospiraceae bacterium]
YYNNKNTEQLLEIHPDEGPVSLQLFGSDPVIMSEMAKRIEERPFAVLDVNMGCPVPKVVNNHEGSALMKNPKLVEEIVTAFVKAIKKPVTIKIRKGFNDENINAVEIARIAEACGASAVAVHGRTREQYYSGKADWDIIARVKDSISIPVIGNGDVVDEESAENMLKMTGCDGIMVGRAAQGNPFIFHQLSHFVKTGEKCAKPTPQQIKEAIMKHAGLSIQYKGEYTAVREMRKHISWYSAGYPNSSKLRARMNEMETMQDILAITEELFG